MAESKRKHRASAMGHRFGPDLICGECGADWESHQVEQKACEPRGKVEVLEPLPEPPPSDDEDPG